MRFEDVTTIPDDAVEAGHSLSAGAALLVGAGGTILFWAAVATWIF